MQSKAVTNYELIWYEFFLLLRDISSGAVAFKAASRTAQLFCCSLTHVRDFVLIRYFLQYTKPDCFVSGIALMSFLQKLITSTKFEFKRRMQISHILLSKSMILSPYKLLMGPKAMSIYAQVHYSVFCFYIWFKFFPHVAMCRHRSL